MREEEKRPAPEVFDASQFEAACGGDPEFEAEIVLDFERQAELLLARMDAAAAAGDASALRTAAHSLKGSARSLGGEAAGAACARLEAIGESGDLAGAPPEVRAAREELVRLIRALGAHREGRAA